MWGQDRRICSLILGVKGLNWTSLSPLETAQFVPETQYLALPLQVAWPGLEEEELEGFWEPLEHYCNSLESSEGAI